MSLLTTFDPYPAWYIWSVHTVTAISTLIFPIGIYCIFYIMSKSTDKLFKRLLASSLTLSYGCQLFTTTGAIPLLLLPMCGGYPLGFLTQMGMPTCFMTGMQVSFIAHVCMFTTLLFFYRQHVVVPLPRPVTYAVLIWFCLTFSVVPIPAHIILCGNLDLIEMKKSYISEYPDYCNQVPNYWNETVIFLGWTGSFPLKSILLYDLYFINFSIVAILFFVRRISAYLNTTAISEYRRNFHHSLIRSLLAQSFVHYYLMLLPSAIVVSSCFFRLQLPGLANLCIILIATSDPCGLLTLLLTHKDYRMAIIRSFKKLWMKMNGQIFVTRLTASVISVQHPPHSARHQ